MLERDYHDGTARVPIGELKFLLGNRQNMIGFDLGSGNGRSTRILQKSLKSSSIILLDQDRKSLRTGNLGNPKVQGLAELLPFRDNLFDFIVLNGLMTNLTSEDPLAAQEKRKQVAKETYRCLKNGGAIFVSDFSSTHEYGEETSYEKYQFITKEWGTIALYPGFKNPLRDLSEDGVLNFAKIHQHAGFVHRYSPSELFEIYYEAGFCKISCEIEQGVMPSGRLCGALILTGVKSR